MAFFTAHLPREVGGSFETGDTEEIFLWRIGRRSREVYGGDADSP